LLVTGQVIIYILTYEYSLNCASKKVDNVTAYRCGYLFLDTTLKYILLCYYYNITCLPLTLDRWHVKTICKLNSDATRFV